MSLVKAVIDVDVFCAKCKCPLDVSEGECYSLQAAPCKVCIADVTKEKKRKKEQKK